MDELVRDGAEDDPGQRPLARRPNDDHAGVALGREREQRLGRPLRDEHRLGLDACLGGACYAGVHQRAADLLECVPRLAPFVADASVRRLDSICDDERVAEPGRELDRPRDRGVGAARSVDADDDGATQCSPPEVAG